MWNEAKYLRKRLNDSDETRYCLTKDDMDIWVTICHIRWGDRFEPELTFCRLARFRVDSAIAIVAKEMLISLLMHCFHCTLTSLISQVLLQVALDKKERDFTGWFSQYEFSSLPSQRVARSTATFRAMPMPIPRQLATTGTTTGEASKIGAKITSLAICVGNRASSHGSSSNWKSAWHK
jgi:hypothetical protein